MFRQRAMPGLCGVFNSNGWLNNTWLLIRLTPVESFSEQACVCMTVKLDTIVNTPSATTKYHIVPQTYTARVTDSRRTANALRSPSRHTISLSLCDSHSAAETSMLLLSSQELCAPVDNLNESTYGTCKPQLLDKRTNLCNYVTRPKQHVPSNEATHRHCGTQNCEISLKLAELGLHVTALHIHMCNHTQTCQTARTAHVTHTGQECRTSYCSARRLSVHVVTLQTHRYT
jgi:hypothetical protein